MTGPDDGNPRSQPVEGDRSIHYAAPDLEAELLQADGDFENGDYIELTAEQLEPYIAGACSWPDESSH
jgi:hypothetical protein